MLFQTQQDIDFMKRINQEMYETFMKSQDVFVYDKQLVDDLYMEDHNKTFTLSALEGAQARQIKAFFPELSDWNLEATKFGLNETRTFFCFIFADTPHPPEIGDVLKVQAEFYRVQKKAIGDYFGNTEVPMTIKLTLVKELVSSIPTSVRVEKEEEVYPTKSSLTWWEEK